MVANGCFLEEAFGEIKTQNDNKVKNSNINNSGSSTNLEVSSSICPICKTNQHFKVTTDNKGLKTIFTCSQNHEPITIHPLTSNLHFTSAKNAWDKVVNSSTHNQTNKSTPINYLSNKVNSTNYIRYASLMDILCSVFFVISNFL